ncbi:MAG: hypothetical protein R3208_20870 [Ketobacteraceae bacterium]|nr:hypothetical protein [Ketobacteraceae bacterium]
MKIIQKGTTLLLLLTLAACSTNAVTIDKISDQVATQGARNYLNSTINNHDVWFAHVDVLQQGLISGNDKALEVLAKLRTVSDAGASTTIDFMVARAIPDNPRIVSKSVECGFRLDAICNIPFIEEEQAVVDKYISETRAALKRRESDGDMLAGKCFDILESRTTRTAE